MVKIIIFYPLVSKQIYVLLTFHYSFSHSCLCLTWASNACTLIGSTEKTKITNRKQVGASNLKDWTHNATLCATLRAIACGGVDTRCNCCVKCCRSRTCFYSCHIARNIARNVASCVRSFSTVNQSATHM